MKLTKQQAETGAKWWADVLKAPKHQIYANDEQRCADGPYAWFAEYFADTYKYHPKQMFFLDSV